MHEYLMIYDTPQDVSEVGGRQGRQGGGVTKTLFPEAITKADIAEACRDQRALSGTALVINGVEVPAELEESVRRFQEIMEKDAVSAYLTQDGLSAGILAPPEWKHDNWETFRLFSKLFFGPAHGVICEIWETEFKAASALHGKG